MVNNTTNTVRKNLGKRIKDLRVAKDYSQESFSFECNLHRTYIGSVERGERNVAIDNIAKIAKALDVEISFLFLDI